MSRSPVSEGVFVYVLGLVVIATRHDRFWLGFTVAAVPVVSSLVLRTYDAVGSRRP